MRHAAASVFDSGMSFGFCALVVRLREGKNQFRYKYLNPCRMRSVEALKVAGFGKERRLQPLARRSLHIGLENRRTLIAYPGFESLVSRHITSTEPAFWRALLFLAFGKNLSAEVIVSASFGVACATRVLSHSAT